MKDPSRTNQELIDENSALKQKIKELEQSELERKHVKQELRKSEENYRFLFDAAPVGIGMTDSEGIVYAANRRIQEITGYTLEDFKTFKIGDMYVDREERQKVLQILYKSGEVRDNEVRLRRKDGTVYPALLNLSQIEYEGRKAFLTALRDITEFKQMEAALSESKRKINDALEFNKTILNTSSIGILTYKESGQCTYANDAAAKIGGTTLAGLLEQNFHQIPSWKKAGMYEAALQALRTGTEQQKETHVTTTFGKDVWLSLQFSSFNSEGENHLLVFTYDITKRKKFEEELLDKSEALEKLNTALKVLIGHYKNDQRELEKNMASNITGRIIPYINKLKQTNLDVGQTAFLEIIEKSFHDISSPFQKLISSRDFCFTPKEIEIISFIKEGKTTKEIAQIIGIAKKTVDTYRNNIRGKLDLANKKVNLRTYLLSIHNT